MGPLPDGMSPMFAEMSLPAGISVFPAPSSPPFGVVPQPPSAKPAASNRVTVGRMGPPHRTYERVAPRDTSCTRSRPPRGGPLEMQVLVGGGRGGGAPVYARVRAIFESLHNMKRSIAPVT